MNNALIASKLRTIFSRKLKTTEPTFPVMMDIFPTNGELHLNIFREVEVGRERRKRAAGVWLSRTGYVLSFTERSVTVDKLHLNKVLAFKGEPTETDMEKITQSFYGFLLSGKVIIEILHKEIADA